MEVCNHVSECMVLEFNITYEISKNTYLPYVFFSIRIFFNDVFKSSECITFDGSVISE
jgi:hypothetical protein